MTSDGHNAGPGGSTGHSSDSAQDPPPHPSQNRKEIVWFLVLIGITALAVHVLAQSKRYENLALYVAGLLPAVGVPAIVFLRRVRCPRCRRVLTRVRTARISGQRWGEYRCADGHGQWRVEESPRTDGGGI